MQMYNKQKLVHKYPVLGSSVDPDEISMRIKGYLVALVPLTLAILRANDVAITETEVMGVINGITAAIAGVLIIWGFIRKFWKS